MGLALTVLLIGTACSSDPDASSQEPAIDDAPAAADPDPSASGSPPSPAANDPDAQVPDPQDPEAQGREPQDPVPGDPDDPETQDPEDPETQDPETQDPETQDSPDTPEGELQIGIQYTPDVSEGARAAGVQANTQSGRRTYEILVEDLNERGGIDGREVVPIWATRESTSADDMTVQEQRTCTQWTQDNRIEVALITAHHTGTLLGCLQDAGVVTLVEPGFGGPDAEIFKQFPHYVSGGTLNLTRMAPVYVDALEAQGFFEADTVEGELTVGLVIENYPAAVRAAEEALKPALEERGIRVAEEGRLPPQYGARGAGEAAAQAPNVVLRFKSQGVNRVLFLSHGYGATAFAFMVSARNQSYSPRYGLTTYNSPTTLKDNGLADQLQGSIGVGWAPFYDVEGRPAGNEEAATACDKLMVSRGQPMDEVGAYWLACDHMKRFESAAKAADGAQADPGSVLSGLYSLGTVEPITIRPLRYGPDQRDGVTKAQHFEFATDCQCFRYSSDPYSIM